jgi:hypothetical protein
MTRNDDGDRCERNADRPGNVRGERTIELTVGRSPTAGTSPNSSIICCLLAPTIIHEAHPVVHNRHRATDQQLALATRARGRRTQIEVQWRFPI